MQIILGLIIMGVGALIIIKSEAVLNAFGRMAWFEEHFGMEGGSRLGYKMIGMLVAFIGILMATGLIGGFIEWMVSPLTRYNQPQ